VTQSRAPRACVFLPNWVGDVVMATPALRALRARLGAGGTLVGLARPHVAGVLEGSGLLDELWPHEPAVARSPRGVLAAARALRRGRFELALLLPNSLHTALIARLAGVPRRVGYARNRRGPLLTTALRPPRQDGRFVPTPAVGAYLALVYALGGPEEPWRLQLATTGLDEVEADEAWAALGLGDRVVTLNSSGAFGAAKLWPEEHFAALAGRLTRELDLHVLVLCGPDERARAAAIARLAADRRVASLAGRPLSLGLTKACVRRSRLLVTTDSGVRHFGAAFGIPVVSLFGPTHIAWSDTRYVRERKLQLALECGPCQQPTCPLLHHRCMRELDVDTVFRAVVGLLGTE
jgi:heptosyltransferase II